MIEKIILDHLSETLTAYMEMPERRPAPPFVLIEKTGGGMEDHISTATIAVQSYGASLLEAAQLNERVKWLMVGAIRLPEITRVELNSDYNFTDTRSKEYRYQAVFDVTFYDEEAGI